MLISLVDNLIIKFFKDGLPEIVSFADGRIGVLVDKYDILLDCGGLLSGLRSRVPANEFAIIVKQFDILMQLDGFIIDGIFLFNEWAHSFVVFGFEFVHFESCSQEQAPVEN